MVDKPSQPATLGLALDQHINSDQIIILGTTGSMWDNLFYQFQLENTHSEALETLIGDIENNSVRAEQLATLAQAASQTYGKPVRCELIPYGHDENEQIAIISQILAYFERGDRAILDITHGLRHLPMLIEQIANLLPTLRNTEIEGIYYGALDLTQNDKTPVMRMDGLQKINQWQNALAVYDQTGNIAAFAKIFAQLNISKEAIRVLEQAAFAEQTHNLRQSYDKIQNLQALLEKEPSNELLNFILPTLKERLTKIKNTPVWQQRFYLAEQALERKDYLRAALYGYEAIFERILEKKSVYSDDYEEKKEAVKKYIRNTRKQFGKHEGNSGRTIVKKYDQLRKLRNMLAHGEEDEQIRGILNNEEKLAKALKECLHELKTLTL